MKTALFAALVVVLTASCTSSAPPLVAPEWDSVPPEVVESVCHRLRSDALATGKLPIVRVTQPLVTKDSLAALALTTGGDTKIVPPVTNRAIPLTLGSSVCTWDPIDVREARTHRDETVVELSAPILNPYVRKEAGLFARATLAGENHESWYWVSLAPTPSGWAVRFVSVLFR